ncbi:MAG: hypothetical protein K8R46_00735 [Pirellulales bacterium]|nr:hypothetical protein [Pirellulales bacterium]
MRPAIARLTVFLVAALATPATADNLSIDFHGLELTFAGGLIYDANHPEGGNSSAAEATALTTIVFTSTEVTSLTSNVSVDIRIDGVPDIPVDEGFVDFMPTEGFVDLFDGATRILHLPMTSASVSYDGFFGFELSAFASSGVIQNLPNSLIFDLDKQISVNLFGLGFESTTIEYDYMTECDYMTGFVESSGYGESLGVLVPEPGSLMILLSLAVSALAVRAWRVASMKARCS